MKKKSFRELLVPVIEERYRNDVESQKRHLKEASTKAAETLITSIRQWPGQYSSRNQALGRFLESDRWNKDGDIVLEKDIKGRPYPLRLPLSLAYEVYIYGDQRKQYYPSFSFPSGLKRIPSNLAEDWVEEIQGLFNDINRMPLKAFKLICLGKWVKSYGTNNPYAIVNWERECNDFEKAQKAIDEFVANRDGWTHLTVDNLQNPKHNVELSKVLTDILANADAIVEPAGKAIREQDRQMNIRQDATQARNSVKRIKEFFISYGTRVDCLDLVDSNINQTETKCLTSGKTELE